MAISRAMGSLGILDPEEVAALQEIFDSACALLKLDSQSPEAEHVAQRLVAAHQSGTLDRKTFLNSLTN